MTVLQDLLISQFGRSLSRHGSLLIDSLAAPRSSNYFLILTSSLLSPLLLSIIVFVHRDWKWRSNITRIYLRFSFQFEYNVEWLQYQLLRDCFFANHDQNSLRLSSIGFCNL